MHSFLIHGEDQDTGAPIELQVSAGSVPEAADFARRRSILVQSIELTGGHTYYPTEDGRFCREDELDLQPDEGNGKRNLDSLFKDTDFLLLAFSFLIPIVGLIAGSIRLAQRDISGARILAMGVVGMFFAVWLVSRL